MAEESELPPTPLAQAIQDLRSSLAQAIELGKGKDLKFDVGNIELEIGLIATQEGGAGGKVSFNLFGLSSEARLDGRLAREATHRVKLNLTPKLNNSSPVMFSVGPTKFSPALTLEEEIAQGLVNPDGSLKSGDAGRVVTVTIPDGSKISVENMDWTKK